MADNITLPGTGEVVATDDVAGRQFQIIKVAFGADGAVTLVDGGAGLPVSGTFWQATQPVSGPLTDAQLRAAAVPVSGPLTDAQLRAAAVPVSGPLTDAQLRATDVPVSGPLTDAQLRATAVPISAAALPLPSGAATETTLAALNAKLPPSGQALMAASQPVAIASNQSAVPTFEAATVFTGAAAQTAIVNNILENPSGAAGTAVDNIRAGSVQVVSTGTGGTFIFEQSNDNANWIALPVYNAALTTGVPITAAITASASQIIYAFPVRCRFIRLRIVSTITGGSIQAFSRFSSDPYSPAVMTVAQPTAGSLNATVAGTVTANIGTGALAAGTNAIGDVGIQVRANATGAASIHHIVSAASTNVVQIKATAGRLLGWSLANNAAGWRYVKLHNVASATAGSGVVQTIGIPPGGKSDCSVPAGLAFGTAISRSIVTGAADADATVLPAAAEVVGDIFFA